MDYSDVKRGKDAYADADAVQRHLQEHGKVYLPFFINATDLAAGTAQQLISPVAGKITKMKTIVQVAIGTGGAITAKVGSTDVTGLSITVADSATVGTVQSDTPTGGDGTDVVAEGSQIQVVPGAAFATAGAVNGYIEITL